MAKKGNERIGVTVESLRPYIERALKDDEFRDNVREAVDAARGVYGDLSKANGLTKSAAKLATDKDVHGNLQRALSELTDAVERVQKTRGGKRRKKRKMLLLAGVVAGTLYNPWTGQSTRDWLLEKIAGEDDLAPLDVETPAASAADASATETNGTEPVAVGSTTADATDN
jgi:hypothetical protein